MGLKTQTMKNATAAKIEVSVPWDRSEVRVVTLQPGETAELPITHEGMLKRRGLSLVGPSAALPEPADDRIATPADLAGDLPKGGSKPKKGW